MKNLLAFLVDAGIFMKTDILVFLFQTLGRHITFLALDESSQVPVSAHVQRTDLQEFYTISDLMIPDLVECCGGYEHRSSGTVPTDPQAESVPPLQKQMPGIPGHYVSTIN